MDRRAFVAFFTTTGLSSTLLPGVLWAQMQPGTTKVTLEMVRESARLAGLSAAIGVDVEGLATSRARATSPERGWSSRWQR